MDKGLVLALLAGIIFAGGMVYVRRGVFQSGETFTSVFSQIIFGLPFFAVAVWISGEFDSLRAIYWQGVLLLSFAGILHFIVGRYLSYSAFGLIGINKTTPYLTTSPLYSAILGIMFLNEPLTSGLVLGVVFIIGGAVLVASERKYVGGVRPSKLSGTEFKGIVIALIGALCWGISPVIIRYVVVRIGSPQAAALVSYTAAALVLMLMLLNPVHRKQVTDLRFSRKALISLLIGAILVSAAHLLNYTALRYSPAGLVTSLTSTSTIFAFVFSFMLNRNLEVFSARIISGMVITVAGVFVIFYL